MDASGLIPEESSRSTYGRAPLFTLLPPSRQRANTERHPEAETRGASARQPARSTDSRSVPTADRPDSRRLLNPRNIVYRCILTVVARRKGKTVHLLTFLLSLCSLRLLLFQTSCLEQEATEKTEESRHPFMDLLDVSNSGTSLPGLPVSGELPLRRKLPFVRQSPRYEGHPLRGSGLVFCVLSQFKLKSGKVSF